jgi:hypothetical protein
VQVAPRTYRNWKTAEPSSRTVTDARVTDALLATIDTPEGTYGRRKMTAYLRRQGVDVARCTVDRLMRDEGLSGIVRGRKHRTTIADNFARYAGLPICLGVYYETLGAAEVARSALVNSIFIRLYEAFYGGRLARMRWECGRRSPAMAFVMDGVGLGAHRSARIWRDRRRRDLVHHQAFEEERAY